MVPFCIRNVCYLFKSWFHQYALPDLEFPHSEPPCSHLKTRTSWLWFSNSEYCGSTAKLIKNSDSLHNCKIKLTNRGWKNVNWKPLTTEMLYRIVNGKNPVSWKFSFQTIWSINKCFQSGIWFVWERCLLPHLRTGDQIPGTSGVEGEKQLLQVVLCLHTSAGISTPTETHVHTKQIKEATKILCCM